MAPEYCEDESSDSLTDVDVLNPEDIDMDEMPGMVPSGDDINRLQPGNPSFERNLPDWPLTPEEAEMLERLFGVQHYEQEDRGELPSASIQGSPCTTVFLDAIIKNIRILRNIFAVELERMNSPDFDPWEDLADIIMSELFRLQEHPELFPCQNKEEWFWQTVHKLCTDVEFELAPAQEQYDRMILDFYVTAWEDRFQKTMPERDQRRRPWEQFLHNRAPGLNVDLSRYGDGGSVQILPMPAIKIASAMREENVTIIADIESKRVDGRPYQAHPVITVIRNGEDLLMIADARTVPYSGEAVARG